MALTPTAQVSYSTVTGAGKKNSLADLPSGQCSGRLGSWHRYPAKYAGVAGTINNLCDHDPVLAQLLFNRGLTKPSEVEIFLRPSYDRINNFGGFEGLLNLEAAVKTLVRHINQKSSIVIFGDYDVDGVCSSVLMGEAITSTGGRALVILPHRGADGYGLQSQSLKKIMAHKPGLVITVDNGSSSGEAIAQLKQEGIEVIVVDHHEVGDLDADQAILLNPKQKAEQAAFKELCATGVAFRLAERLYSYLQVGAGQEKWLLDLVAVASVADMVPLLGDNRALVYFGLKTLNKTRRPGFKWLLEKVSPRQPANAESIGYGIGPRLNAAGRLEDATRAFELVSADNRDKAARAGERLEQLNLKRRALTRQVCEEADQKAAKQKDQASIVVADKYWPRGVCGLVAGRLAEKYNKPVFVLEKSEPAVGSGRGVTGFNLAQVLVNRSDLFVRAGGHAMAAGCTIATKNIDLFREYLATEVKKELKGKRSRRIFSYELVLPLARIDNNFLDLQEKLEPFGVANPKPIVRVDQCKIMNIRLMGQKNNHMGLRLEQNGVIKRAVFFSRAPDFADLKIGDKISVLALVSENNWQGRRSAELQIIDIMKK